MDTGPDSSMASFSSVADAQGTIAEFFGRHGIDVPTEYRLPVRPSEPGEFVKNANVSTGYGATPDEVELPADELGDPVFALLALCERADVDAGDALDDAVEKYESKLEDSERPRSGK